MKIIITESQLNTLNESTRKKQDLCATFSNGHFFCHKIEKMLKPGGLGSKKNLITLSKNFFDRVVKNPKYFNVVILTPENEKYQERMKVLEEFIDILKKYKSCPEIVSDLNKEIQVLPKKGLQMVVDDKNQYSLLNRLDTHYSAKSYLLTKIILDNNLESFLEEKGEEKINLNNLSDDKIIDLITTHVFDDLYVDDVSEYLKNLLDNDEIFRNYLFGALEYSREVGNEIEQDFFNRLRNKYGENKVFEFSGDFGFVDDFGVDGVVIINDIAHPIQISSQKKANPKVFSYSSQYCKPLGYYKQGNNLMTYERF